MRVVLFLLFFPDDDPDFEDPSLVVSHFMDFCEGAGVPSDRQRRRLVEAHGPLLGGQADA